MKSSSFTTELVMFDLDGTLVDTVSDLTHSLNTMLSTFGKQPVAVAQVRAWIGAGVEELVTRALKGQDGGILKNQVRQQAIELFRSHYRMHVCDCSKLYPGALETLNALKFNGAKLACVTNKASVFTRPLISALGLDDLFSFLMCGDQVEHKKPDPMPLLQTCARLNTHPSKSIMIGDSVNDLLAAQAAQVPAICVSYGYSRGQDLTRFTNVKMIDNLTEILNLIVLKTGIMRTSSIQH